MYCIRVLSKNSTSIFFQIKTERSEVQYIIIYTCFVQGGLKSLHTFSLLMKYSNSEIGHVFCCRALNGRGWKWIAHTLALVSTLQCRSFSLSTHAEFQKLDGHLLASQFLKILGKLTCSRARKKDYNGGQ